METKPDSRDGHHLKALATPPPDFQSATFVPDSQPNNNPPKLLQETLDMGNMGTQAYQMPVTPEEGEGVEMHNTQQSQPIPILPPIPLQTQTVPSYIQTADFPSQLINPLSQPDPTDSDVELESMSPCPELTPSPEPSDGIQPESPPPGPATPRPLTADIMASEGSFFINIDDIKKFITNQTDIVESRLDDRNTVKPALARIREYIANLEAAGFQGHVRRCNVWDAKLLGCLDMTIYDPEGHGPETTTIESVVGWILAEAGREFLISGQYLHTLGAAMDEHFRWELLFKLHDQADEYLGWVLDGLETISMDV